MAESDIAASARLELFPALLAHELHQLPCRVNRATVLTVPFTPFWGSVPFWCFGDSLPRNSRIESPVVRGMNWFGESDKIEDVVVVRIVVAVVYLVLLWEWAVVELPHVPVHRASVLPAGLVPVLPASGLAVVVAVE